MDALFILGTVKTFFEGAKRVYNTMKKREIVKTSTYIYIFSMVASLAKMGKEFLECNIRHE